LAIGAARKCFSSGIGKAIFGKMPTPRRRTRDQGMRVHDFKLGPA
jgi:hypothetical protein